MTAGLVTALKQFEELANKSQLKEIRGALWALVSQGENPKQRGIGRLLTEADEEEPGSIGGEDGGGGDRETESREVADRNKNGGAAFQGEWDRGGIEARRMILIHTQVRTAIWGTPEHDKNNPGSAAPSWA